MTILEKGDLLDGCSFGNMGHLPISHVVPLAAPGMLGKGIRWMFNSSSPFYIKPSLRPSLLRWGIRFLANSTQKHVQYSAKPLAELMQLTKQLLLADWSPKMNIQTTQNGLLMLCKKEATLHEELETASLVRSLGMQAIELSKEEVLAMEPAVRPDVCGAVWYKDDLHLQPNALMAQLPALLEARGVKILRNAEVASFDRSKGKILSLRLKNGEIMQADVFVLATGSWSPAMARMAGERIDLMPGKGYAMTLDMSDPQLRHPAILVDAKVAMTPWAGSLRIGSTMEIAPMNESVHWARVQGILDAVPEFLPGLAGNMALDQLKKGIDQAARSHAVAYPGLWYGFRPVSYDGLPYIGWAPHNSNLLMATGHAMLGVSMSTGTGKLIAEMACGKPVSIPVEAFRPGR